MRGMAEYVMLGRRQAIIFVLLCGFFPLLYFLSAAVVALVTLRKGRNEGLLILLWSMLPAGTLLALGDVSLMFLVTGSFALGMALKKTMSWPLVMLLATAMGLLAQWSLVFQTSYQAQITALVNESLRAQIDQGGQTAYTADQFVNLLFTFYGTYHAMLIILCLMIGRWWQASLYNPGGFRQEFHSLRFGPRVMVVLLGLILAGLLDITPLDNWMPLFCVPPLLGGLAVAHYIVAKKNLGSHWLVLTYITVLMMAPAVILLGMTDSLMDLRRRLDQRDPPAE